MEAGTGNWITTIIWGFFVGFGLAAGMALFNGFISLFQRNKA